MGANQLSEEKFIYISMHTNKESSDVFNQNKQKRSSGSNNGWINKQSGA